MNQSTDTISIKQYNRAKNIIKKAMDSDLIIRPHAWNVKWNKSHNKWEHEFNYNQCCPLAAVLICDQPKRITAKAPYDILDKNDHYASSIFRTLSKLLDVPDDFIHGFLYKIDNSSMKIDQFLNDGLPKEFPKNKLKNIKNFNKGITCATWIENNYL